MESAPKAGHKWARQGVPWQSGESMRPTPSFPIRRYLHGDLSDDGSGRAFCARCGGFHPGEHFGDAFHAMIQSAKLAQSVGSWMHNAPRPGRPASRPSNAPNLFSQDVRAIAETLRAPNWTR